MPDLPPGRWPIGADKIQDMIDTGVLQQGIRIDSAHIQAMFDDAERHLRTAEAARIGDPKGAYALMYDGVRKALVAALAAQHLRVRGGDGGHANLGNAVRVQLGDNAGRLVAPFDRMRRKRNGIEYDFDVEVYPEDIDDDLPKARAIVERVRIWTDRLGPFS